MKGTETNNQSVHTLIITPARQSLRLTGLVLAIGFVLIPTAQAASYSVDKFLDWNISKTDPITGKVTDVAGPKTGSATTAYHVFAMDAHGGDHKDNLDRGGIPISLA